jgi:hypothetical protein
MLKSVAHSDEHHLHTTFMPTQLTEKQPPFSLAFLWRAHRALIPSIKLCHHTLRMHAHHVAHDCNFLRSVFPDRTYLLIIPAWGNTPHYLMLFLANNVSRAGVHMLAPLAASVFRRGPIGTPTYIEGKSTHYTVNVLGHHDHSGKLWHTVSCSSTYRISRLKFQHWYIYPTVSIPHGEHTLLTRLLSDI